LCIVLSGKRIMHGLKSRFVWRYLVVKILLEVRSILYIKYEYDNMPSPCISINDGM
jgi:hypothetical protein